VSVFLIVRTWVELVTIDYSDPSSYAHDWGFGVTAWRRGERGDSVRRLADSVRRLADAEYRDKSATTTQILMRDTLTLAVVTIVPLPLAVSVAANAARGRG
jgi:hypothetical protein